MRIISCDWLSLYCHVNFITSNSMYQFIKHEQGTRQFKELYNVYDLVDGELYATVQAKPYSRIIPANAAIVKISNRYLYKQNWNTQIMYFLNLCHFIPQSISRIDICCDFNKFDNNLGVNSFIQGFMRSRYLKNGRATYQIQGEQKAEHEVSYLRFGQHDSEVSVYLYNKSKEMREVVNKPYITELWKKNGLDTTKDVWRLEISLKTTQTRFIIQKTGETFRLDLDFIKTHGILENIFDCVALKYFEFKHNNLTKNKSRMKTVVFFNDMKSSLSIYTPTNDACSNRMDKILIKKLANAMTELRLTESEFPEYIAETLATYIEQKDLVQWYRLNVEPNIKTFKEK